MPLDLSGAALAFSRVFGARQRGALEGAQRARENAAAAAADEREMERFSLDKAAKEAAAKRSAFEMDPYKGKGREGYFKDLTDEKAIEANARIAAELATQRQQTPRVDPLSPEGIKATAERTKAVEAARAPFARAGADQSGRAMRQATQLTGMYNMDPTFKEAGVMASALGGIKAAAATPGATGDISLVYGFMKLMDPGSVVREGEFATAQNAGGVPETIRNTYNKLKSGGFLTPEQRQAFIGQAEAKARAHRQQLKATMQRYSAMAQRYGVDPADVVFDPYETVLDASPASPRATGTGRPGVPVNAPNPWRQ